MNLFLNDRFKAQASCIIIMKPTEVRILQLTENSELDHSLGAKGIKSNKNKVYVVWSHILG